MPPPGGPPHHSSTRPSTEGRLGSATDQERTLDLVPTDARAILALGTIDDLLDLAAAEAALALIAERLTGTDVLHLPVRASGDGGMHATLDDVHALWQASFAGQVIARQWVAELVRVRSEVPSEVTGDGLGFWLDDDAALLEGYDPGVSFGSVHNPVTGTTHTVIATTSEGARPLARALAVVMGGCSQSRFRPSTRRSVNAPTDHCSPSGNRLDRHAAGRIVRRLATRAGIDTSIWPHSP